MKLGHYVKNQNVFLEFDNGSVSARVGISLF